MKLTLTFIFSLLLSIFLLSFCAKAQTANQLIRLNNVADVNAMNAIATPNEGNLVYVSSTDEVYYYGNGSWKLISEPAPPTVDNNDDAWGVTGEDIVSDISRTGKVTIGQEYDTSTKLEVNGGVFVRSLPDDYSHGRPILSYFNGLLQTDRKTTHTHSISSWSFNDVCFAYNGVTVTGFYKTDNNCSLGHFKFRYQKNVSPLYQMIYNTGNGIFSYDATTGIYRLTAPSYCGAYFFEFRVLNNNIQTRAGDFNTGPYFIDMRLEGY